MLPKLPREKLLDLCRRMLTIRYFEESLIGIYSRGQFQGHYHVYIGQEATGVAAISCLDDRDYLFTTHRNHGHLLARGADPRRLFAEILGRRDGYNKGKGGSFHASSGELGFLQTSAIVGGVIPLTAGVAYAAKSLRNRRIGVALFGDGALEEGAAAETFNLASLWKLPVLFLCENNGKYGRGRAAAAVPSSSMAVYPLTELPAAYKIPSQQVDGADAGAVYEVVSQAVKKIRAGEGPQFVEAQTVRWPGNEANWPQIPVPTDVAFAWSSSGVPEGVREWYQESDPVLLFVRALVEEGMATKEAIAELDRTTRKTVEQAAEAALASPFPDVEEALKDVFA